MYEILINSSLFLFFWINLVKDLRKYLFLFFLCIIFSISIIFSSQCPRRETAQMNCNDLQGSRFDLLIEPSHTYLQSYLFVIKLSSVR